MNFLIKSNDPNKSTAKGLELGLELAQKDGLDILLVVPQIQNLKNSPILEEIFGKTLHKKLIKDRKILINNKNNENNENYLSVTLAKDSILRSFNGIIIGLWTTVEDLNQIKKCAHDVSTVIITEWIPGEMDEWINEGGVEVVIVD